MSTENPSQSIHYLFLFCCFFFFFFLFLFFSVLFFLHRHFWFQVVHVEVFHCILLWYLSLITIVLSSFRQTCIIRAWDPQRPLLYCPAMNTYMWNHPLTSSHVHTLTELGYTQVPPVTKLLACGDQGISKNRIYCRYCIPWHGSALVLNTNCKMKKVYSLATLTFGKRNCVLFAPIMAKRCCCLHASA